MINLMQGDCLERMKEIPDGSVDLILTDPPYGTVNGLGAGVDKYRDNMGNISWDNTIDHKMLMGECNRILRVNGAMILFSQDPYTCKIITDTHPNLPFSYRLTWLKSHFANCLLANKAPVSYTEDICVFFKKYDTLNQHPLRLYAKSVLEFIGASKKYVIDIVGGSLDHFFRIDSTQFGLCTETAYDLLNKHFQIDKMTGFKPFSELVEIDSAFKRAFNLRQGEKYKSNVLEYKKDSGNIHPTQKPVHLLEDLIETYSNEGNTVLDFTFGSCSTGVACVNTGRKFIGIEMDADYFKAGSERVHQTETPTQSQSSTSPSNILDMLGLVA